jgi:hypothetical protein
MTERQQTSQFLIYRSESGAIKIDVRFEGETVWLTQQLMAELFQTSQQNISLHLQNVYEEAELDREATHKEFLSVRQEGGRQVSRTLDSFNLDAIISVGYRVKSGVATQFRIWATQRLREYIVKGFAMDDERLKNPDLPFDYFDELLRRIQDIRTSESWTASCNSTSAGSSPMPEPSPTNSPSSTPIRNTTATTGSVSRCSQWHRMTSTGA